MIHWTQHDRSRSPRSTTRGVTQAGRRCYASLLRGRPRRPPGRRWRRRWQRWPGGRPGAWARRGRLRWRRRARRRLWRPPLRARRQRRRAGHARGVEFAELVARERRWRRLKGRHGTGCCHRSANTHQRTGRARRLAQPPSHLLRLSTDVHDAHRDEQSGGRDDPEDPDHDAREREAAPPQHAQLLRALLVLLRVDHHLCASAEAGGVAVTLRARSGGAASLLPSQPTPLGPPPHLEILLVVPERPRDAARPAAAGGRSELHGDCLLRRLWDVPCGGTDLQKQGRLSCLPSSSAAAGWQPLRPARELTWELRLLRNLQEELLCKILCLSAVLVVGCGTNVAEDRVCSAEQGRLESAGSNCGEGGPSPGRRSRERQAGEPPWRWGDPGERQRVRAHSAPLRGDMLSPSL